MDLLRTLQAFQRDDSGSTAAEFGLISILFLGLMLGVVDAGRLAWEINSAKAATRWGARYAAVTPMVSSIYANFDAIAGGASSGDPINNPPATITCTGPTPTCSSGGANTTAFTNLVAQMTARYGPATAPRIVVEYRHAGVGVAGNPYGPDSEPLITVRLTGLTFQPLALGMLGLQPFTLPDMASTYSSEDVS